MRVFNIDRGASAHGFSGALPSVLVGCDDIACSGIEARESRNARKLRIDRPRSEIDLI